MGRLASRERLASRGRLTSIAARLLACAAAVMLPALLCLISPGRANAEAAVTVGPEEVSAALFVAGDVSRLSVVPSGTESLVLEKALQQLYADEGELAPATAEAYVNQMKTILQAPSAPSPASLQLMAGNQRIVAILATLELPPGEGAEELPPAAKLAISHLAAVALQGSSDIFAKAEEPKYFEPLADERTNLTFTSFAPATVLRATRKLAGNDRSFGEARDELWGKASEESVFSDWKALLGESAVLRSEGLTEVRELVETGSGTITATPEELTALFTAGQQQTQEQACAHGAGEEEIGTETIKGIPPLKCSGGALYEAAHAPSKCTEKCEEELERHRSAAEKREEAIAQERAEMIAAAELLRPSDNEAAALQDATAQAQAQITEEEAAWAAYEAQKAEKEAIAGGVKEGLGAGTAVLALATDNYSEGIGGLINVGFEIYEGVEGALSNPPPGPQEITLQAIADLSEQLAGFQQYTQEAFHALNTQLAQLSSQLALENAELKEQISNLGERLQHEQTTIYRLQAEVQTLFAAQTEANLQQTIEDSVGWLERTGEPLAAPSFQQALVALKKDATEIANGALVNNAEVQPYTFEGADRQLTSQSTGEPAQLSEDISYLARFPGEQGWPSPAAPSTLANTTFWSESSRAYAQLMLENAGHTTSADIAGLKALEAEAIKLQKTQGAWSEPSAPGIETGNAILNEAISHFEKAAFGSGVDKDSSVETLLQNSAETSFAEALKVVKTKSPAANPTEASLWGGAEQPFNGGAVYAAEYPALKWRECAGSQGKNGEVQMPEGFIESLPKALVNAVRLGVVGGPGSGDPLILKACRTITGASEGEAHVSEKTVEKREVCPEWGGVRKDCEVAAVFKTRSETNEETVGETLELSEESTKYSLESPKICKQSALHWRGSGELYTEDATTKTKEDFYEGTFTGSFTERHVGTVELHDAYIKDDGKKVDWGPEYSEEPLAVFLNGQHCLYEGSEEAAGVEYAAYGSGESPFGAGSQMGQATLVEKVDARLQSLQEAAYQEGAHGLAFPAEGAGSPIESLAGARALVQSFIKLGLPQAVGSDLPLQEDIEGLGAQFLGPKPEGPLPLDEQLELLIGHWIHRLKEASGAALQGLLQENPITEVQSRSEEWADEIVTQIKPYVEGKAEGFSTGAQEPVSEDSALVESTLNRLRLTRDVLSEARAPTAETLTPGSVGTSEATVRGEVDPNGGAVESCIFEYGATESYGRTVECSTIPDASEKAVVVSAEIANWTPEGSFHERVVMKTWGGTSYGQDVKVQLAQSTSSPSGALLLASTDTTGATVGKFTAEELPPGVPLPAGVTQLVGSLSFTVNVTPGGGALVRIELPEGSAPNALYKLIHDAGGDRYVEIPSSLYTISGNIIELTLVDGGPDDEDGAVNGVIVDPLVPVLVGSPPSQSPPSPTAPASSGASTANTAPRQSNLHHPARQCVSGGAVTLHIASYLKVPRGAKIEHSKILLGGRVIARLGEDAGGALLSLARPQTARTRNGRRHGNQPKGSYKLMIVVWLSNGHKIRRRIVLHNCAYTTAVSRKCVRNGTVPVHITSYLKVPRGVKVEHSEILHGRRVLARLGRHASGALISFAGLQGGRPQNGASMGHSRGGVPAGEGQTNEEKANEGRSAGSRYRIKIVAKLSNGHTLRRRVIFRAC